MTAATNQSTHCLNSLGVSRTNWKFSPILVTRIIVGAAMAIYVVGGFTHGHILPKDRLVTAFTYFIIAVTIPIVYWSRPISQRYAVSAILFAGFTAYLFGSWCYYSYIHNSQIHNGSRAWIWIAVWYVEIYVEGAFLRGRPFDPVYPVTALREHLEERRSLVQQLADTKLQLERSNRFLTLSAVASSIAHEICQPLAAVAVNAGAANNWLSANNVPEAKQAIARVVDDSHRANAVIESFRNLLQEGEQVRVIIDVVSIINQAIAIHGARISNLEVGVRVRSLRDMPKISGDPIQISQVFLNLIGNALDALNEQYDKSRKIIIYFETTTDEKITISIEDNGNGVKDENRIWDLFFTTKSDGLGMGLFVSRTIVESHGGTLTVKSQPGRTTFNVSLPIADPKQYESNSVYSRGRQIAARGHDELVALGWLRSDRL